MKTPSNNTKALSNPNLDHEVLERFENDELAAGKKLFSMPCEFIKGCVALTHLPLDGRLEVAFAGRSNVGKSSLINALTGRKALARTSNTPGRTRELNYFQLNDNMYLVDMPGYGYARASKDLVQNWTALIQDYLRGRPQLRRVFLLIDARHGLKDSDRSTMELMDRSAVSYQVVLTKVDKLKHADLMTMLSKTAQALTKHPAAHPHLIATSSRKTTGLLELKASVAKFLM
ncbi:MAG: ribosome biogenesis GTP-binding protein YihA/YsxC [Pseudomonadota bacterium]